MKYQPNGRPPFLPEREVEKFKAHIQRLIDRRPGPPQTLIKVRRLVSNDEIQALLNSHASVSYISRVTGMSRDAIYRRMQRANLSRPAA